MVSYLIVNADDFGMSGLFNSSILALIRDGCVSSTTVMVDRLKDTMLLQVEELRSLSVTKKISVGLHLEFKDKDYSTAIEAQFITFKQIFGFAPSHVDIHKSSTIPDSFKFVAEFCSKNGLKMRNCGEYFKGVSATKEEAFFGSVDTFSKIESWLSTLKDGEYYEILFHPGIYDKDSTSSLNKQREVDSKHVVMMNKVLSKYGVRMISYLDIK